MDRRTLLATLASGAAMAASPFARAQEYPAQLIKWVVPYPAGGGTDVIARVLAEAMRQTLGQQIVVDNRPGASTNIGADIVAKSKPDGYTILSADNAVLAFNEHLFSKLPFSPEKDFTYIGAIGKFPLALVVHPDFPAKDFKEFLAYVKANKAKVSYANAGIGAASHLCGMLFMSAIQTDVLTVPYKGTGPAMNDLLGGTVDFMCDQTTSTTSQIKAGKVRVYGVTSKKRVPSLPDVPTLDEQGLKGFEVGIWHAFYAPRGTPKPVVDKLASALQEALKDETVKKRFADLGAEAVPAEKSTPAGHAAHLKAEIDKWAPIIKKAGVYAD